MTDTPTLTHEQKRPPRTFTITVNEVTEVTLTEHNLNGAEIKAAAIRAGAPIQADFVLSKVLPNGKQRIVPDDKQIHVKEGDEFWAVPGDDNS
jgi:hypothetical protein